MATIVEVARLAGVSTSTVSHVLNGTRRVEPATRRRVLDAIAKTDYRQDALARAMRRSRTDSIGLVIPDGGEPAFAEMVNGVGTAAAAKGLTLLLATSGEDAEREITSVRTLLERRVDGLIVARAGSSSDEPLPGRNGPHTAAIAGHFFNLKSAWRVKLHRGDARRGGVTCQIVSSSRPIAGWSASRSG